MAVTYNQMNTFSRDFIVKKLVNNVYKSSAIAYRLLRKSRRWNGGPQYHTPIISSKNTNAEAYRGSAQLTIAQVEEATKAYYDYRQYNAAVTLTGIEMEVNKGSDTKILNLVSEKMRLAEMSLKDLFGGDLFNTPRGSQLDGLSSICAAHSSTHGGVSSADVSTWLSSSINGGLMGGPDSTTSTLTPTNLAKGYNNARIDSDAPTLILTTDDIWAGIYGSIIETNHRYMDTEMAQLGFDAVKYRKALVITDSHVPSSHLYYINENHLWFAHFPGMNFKWIPWTRSRDYDLVTGHIRWYGNLICDARWSVAEHSNISTVSAS